VPPPGLIGVGWVVVVDVEEVVGAAAAAATVPFGAGATAGAAVGVVGGAESLAPALSRRG
jgi:hypothetical protein